MVTFTQEHCTQSNFITKLVYSMGAYTMTIKRIQQKLQEIPGSSNTVSECSNIKTINSQAADERLGEYKSFTQKKKLKKCDEEINLTVQQKSLAYRKYLHTNTTDKEQKNHCQNRNQKNKSKILGTIYITLRI